EVFTKLEDSLAGVIPYLAQGSLFVRGGAVGWQGQAILLPGYGVGITTLVTALLQAGASYYGDYYTILDPEGKVHPYLTPLMIQTGCGENANKVSAEALGGSPGEDPLPVGLIAWTTYEAGARWRPRALAPSRAVLSLLPSTPARRNAEFALPVLRRAVSGARLLRSKRGEAEATAKALLAAIGDQ
ncbi:MAG: hypothetical protein R3264_11000, partial [Anaerolineae bacterium]|nr:hypothetical protein [Anaerolineae bacterium]